MEGQSGSRSRSPFRPPGALGVTLLCGLLVVAEGYDLIVYGTLIPSLLHQPGWGMTAGSVGTVGSMVYIGMLLGALASGPLTDRFGRRRAILAAVAWFTAGTAACALAADPWQLGLFRALAGLGMGAVMPGAIALCKEYAPSKRTGLATTTLMAGVPLGGITAAILATAVLPEHGWRVMFGLGAAIGVLVFAAAARKLPESTAFQTAGPAPTPPSPLQVLSRRHATVSVLCAAIAFANLLTWYGLNTWLTQLMRQLHYPLGSALRFSLTLNAGAVIGSFALAAIADRWASHRAAAVGSALTALGVVLLAQGTPDTAVLLAVIAVIGLGAQSSLNLLNAWVADHYPTALRATALGWTNGVGRVGAILAPSLGGWVLAAGADPHAVFLCFAGASLTATVLLTVLVALTRPSRPAVLPSEGDGITASASAGR